MIRTCGNHPKLETDVRAEQAKAAERGEPGPTLFFVGQIDCDYCPDREMTR